MVKLGTFLQNKPAWMIGVTATLLLGLTAGVGYLLVANPQQLVNTGAIPCPLQAHRLASLFSDDETTSIRISNRDFSDLRILRTEPAATLPGMFGSLLALSPDSSRLAYVTADSELMDKAHVWAVDVANPAVKSELAYFPTGLWPTRPAWSPDHRRLAFVTVDDSSATSKPRLTVWVADADKRPAKVSKAFDVSLESLTEIQSESLCWTSDNRVTVRRPTVPGSATTEPLPTGIAASGSEPTPPSGGASCGVPIFSQNDPTWRHLIMQAGGDPIGAYGCALTSTAMLLNYYGSILTPAELNACLGSSADPIVWAAAPECSHASIAFGARSDFSWEAVDNVLETGSPVIVGMVRGQTGMHFVVVTSGRGGLSENYTITDPWDGTTFKTLGSYTNTGYNPRWLITYGGAGRTCRRFRAEPSRLPVLPGIIDSGVYNSSVALGLLAQAKGLTAFITKLSSGKIDANLINIPLPATRITPNLVISEEGIYQLAVNAIAPSGSRRVILSKFTIDHTAPLVDVAFLNLVPTGSDHPSPSGSAVSDWPQPMAADSGNPLVERPARLQLLHHDNLSGVAGVDYQLDGAAWSTYTDEVNFSRTLLVDPPGQHAIAFRGTDLAGNVSPTVVQMFTVVGEAASPPAASPPTPVPTAPPRPAPAPRLPSVQSLTPVCGPIGGGGSVTVRGAGFTGASAVLFGGIPATFRLRSDAEIVAVNPAQPAGTPSTVDVQVRTLTGLSPPTPGDKFTYSPTVSYLKPSSGPAGQSTLVTIIGTGFVAGATRVYFGRVLADARVISPTQITAISPSTFPKGAVVDVRVSDPLGTSCINRPGDVFTYT